MAAQRATAPVLAPPTARPSRSTTSLRGAGLVLALALLALVVVLSIGIGAKGIPPGRVWHELLHPGHSADGIVIRDLRLPRTLLGLEVGAALGVAGALMQALTRNPLADPGLLGVNAGAATAVVVAMALGATSLAGYVWFAFAGAALAMVVVYGLGMSGRAAASPVRLALAGTALSAALTAFVSGMVLIEPQTFDRFRFWEVGSLADHPASLTGQIAPFVVVGLLVALSLARPLNALALGDDAGRALGAHVGRTRAVAALAITLLCGAATAAAGPIVFLGLAVPHMVRAITGPDQRWLLPYVLVLSPCLLLIADIVGRVVAEPGELEVGIVTAFLGAPVFLALVRRRRLAQL